MKKYESYNLPAHKQYNEDKDLPLVLAGFMYGMFTMTQQLVGAIIRIADRPTSVTTITKTYNITNNYYGGR